MKYRPIRTALLSIALLATPALAGASFAQREEVRSFVAQMEAEHGFSSIELLAAFDRARFEPRVIKLITPPTSPGARSWKRYRAQFLEGKRIENGLAFWDEHRDALEAAYQRYGVPPEVIVAIIGVETFYGRYTGSFDALSALATLAFDYPPRAPLFRRELENLFLLAREQGRDPLTYQGSYAGALGFPQFLPSSIRHYAVDFDGNGQVEIDVSPVDAIGSVANYLAVHGWLRGEPVATRAWVAPEADASALVKAGIEPSLSPQTLAQSGVKPLRGAAHPAPATLVDLVTPDAPTEYWLGYRNFYVITRYNKSSFYAMAVYELSQMLSERRAVEQPRS